MDVLRGLRDAPTVEPDVAGVDQTLGEGPAFQQPDEEQEPIEPH